MAIWLVVLACGSGIELISETEAISLRTDDLTGAGNFHSGDPIAAGSAFCLQDDQGEDTFECPQLDRERCLSFGDPGTEVIELAAEGCDFDPDRLVFEVVPRQELVPRLVFPVETFIDDTDLSAEGFTLVTDPPDILTPPADQALQVNSVGSFPAAWELDHPDHQEPVTVSVDDWLPTAAGAEAVAAETLFGLFEPTDASGELLLDGALAATWEVAEVVETRLHVAIADSADDFLAPGFAYFEARDAAGRLVKGLPVAWTLAFGNGLEILPSDEDSQVASLSGFCVPLGSREKSIRATLRADAEGFNLSERIEILLPAEPEGWSELQGGCPGRLSGLGCRVSSVAPTSGAAALAWVLLMARRRRPVRRRP